MRPGPGAVGGQRAALERAEADLVEPRLDDERDAAPGEREREGLLRAPEPRADAEVDRLRRELRAEGTRLLGALRREARARRDRR